MFAGGARLCHAVRLVYTIASMFITRHDFILILLTPNYCWKYEDSRAWSKHYLIAYTGPLYGYEKA